jgi:hypothetical protein
MDATENLRAVENEGRRWHADLGRCADPRILRDARAYTRSTSWGILDVLVNNAAFQEHAERLRISRTSTWT